MCTSTLLNFGVRIVLFALLKPLRSAEEILKEERVVGSVTNLIRYRNRVTITLW